MDGLAADPTASGDARLRTLRAIAQWQGSGRFVRRCCGLTTGVVP